VSTEFKKQLDAKECKAKEGSASYATPLRLFFCQSIKCLFTQLRQSKSHHRVAHKVRPFVMT
jgi:hypothetical protein